MTSADAFFLNAAGPLKQGDILLAGVARLVAEDQFCPAPWESIELNLIEIEGGKSDSKPQLLGAGPALVMVTSHDCHFDKEWNRKRSELIKQGIDPSEAERLAEEDPSLDRTFTASPLIDPHDVPVDRGNLMAGRVVGYLPVPASSNGLVPEAVVDLSYRVTLDRLDVVVISSVSEAVRAQLRYALARLDSLRATQLGFEVEAVLGRTIQQVDIPKQNPVVVRLRLDDGSVVELLQQPGEPGPGPARVGKSA